VSLSVGSSGFLPADHEKSTDMHRSYQPPMLAGIVGIAYTLALALTGVLEFGIEPLVESDGGNNKVGEDHSKVEAKVQ
jgi:hypothetical protein